MNPFESEGIEQFKLAVVSTAHLKINTLRRLEDAAAAPEQRMVFDREEGVLVMMAANPDAAPYQPPFWSTDVMAHELHRVQCLAWDAGFSAVLFDRDAEELDGVEVYPH